MRAFRVRLTATAVIERFVTVTVDDDGPNAEMLAKGLAHQEGRKAGEVWTVRGSALDRIGDPEEVRIADLSALNSSVFTGEAVEEVEGVEIVKISADGFERLDFIPLAGLSEADQNEAYERAARARDGHRRTLGPNEAVQLRDPFGPA